MRIGLAAVLLLVAAWGAQAAAAERARAVQGEVGVASDYILRGYSQSDDDPVLQAGLRYRHRSGFFGGGWIATVEFDDDRRVNDRRDAEVRVFAGYAGSIGQDWAWSGLLVRYEYPGADDAIDTSYGEAQLSAQFRDLLSLTVAYTPQFLGFDASAGFAELTAGYPLPLSLDVSAAIGFAELDSPVEDYSYAHLAVSRSVGRASLALGYYDSDGPDIPRWGEVVDGSWVLSLNVRFP